VTAGLREQTADAGFAVGWVTLARREQWRPARLQADGSPLQRPVRGGAGCLAAPPLLLSFRRGYNVVAASWEMSGVF
jgi:hypothetical protein